MTPIEGKEFKGERIVIDDGQEYRKCTFSNCELVVTGKDALRLGNCRLNVCSVTFESHAGATLQTLSLLYGAGLSATVEAIFAQVRGEGQKWQT